jgi:short-subunit dehydrogenase
VSAYPTSATPIHPPRRPSSRPGGFLADGAVDAAREQFEVNFVSPLRMARAFAPVLAKNGGGAIINVLSVSSWMNSPRLATYGASKSAEWALTTAFASSLRNRAPRSSRCMPASSTRTSPAISTRRRVRPKRSRGRRLRHSSEAKVRCWLTRSPERSTEVYPRIPRPISKAPLRSADTTSSQTTQEASISTSDFPGKDAASLARDDGPTSV